MRGIEKDVWSLSIRYECGSSERKDKGTPISVSTVEKKRKKKSPDSTLKS